MQPVNRLMAANDSTRPAPAARRIMVALALVALAAATPLAARADDKAWNNPAGGSFQLDTNWTPTGVPGTSDTATFDLNAANLYTVTFSADVTNQQLRVLHGQVEFQMNGSSTYKLTASQDSVVIGESTGDQAVLTTFGGTLNSAGITIGKAAGASGSLSALDTLTGAAVVGESGNGSLFLEGNGFTGPSLAIGVNAGSKGTVIDDSTNGINITGKIQIGIGGAGTLQGSNIKVACDTLDIGVLAGSVGRFIGDSGGPHKVAGKVRVGVAGTGSMFLSGTMQCDSAVLGEQAGSSGFAEFAPLAKWTITNTLDVGVAGNGGVTIDDHSSLQSGDTRIGVLSGSNGSVLIDSQSEPVQWDAGNITVGQAGNGQVSLRGATLNAKDVFVGKLDGSNGTFTAVSDDFFKSQANLSGSLYIAGDKTSAHSGTALVVVAGDDEGIKKSELKVAGTTTVYKNGTLELQRGGILSSGGDGIRLHGALTGDGNIVGDVDSEGGRIAPHGAFFGFPIERLNAGTVVIDGLLKQDAASRLEFGLGGTTQGGPPAQFGQGGYDFVKVMGDTTLGGLLFVSFFNDFENQVQPSDTFTVLDADQPLDGFFKNVANGERLTSTDKFFSFIVHYGEGSTFDPSDLVLSDFQRNVPAVPLPPTAWSAGMMLCGIIGTQCMRRRFTRSGVKAARLMSDDVIEGVAQFWISFEIGVGLPRVAVDAQRTGAQSVNASRRQPQRPVTFAYSISGESFSYKRDMYVTGLNMGDKVRLLIDPARPAKVMILQRPPKS